MSGPSFPDPPFIAVFPAGRLETNRRTFEALGELYGVKFAAADQDALPSFRFAWLFDAAREQALEWGQRGVRVLAFAGGLPEPMAAPAERVVFAESPALGKCFRGRALEDPSLTRSCPLPPGEGDEVLAEKGGHPLWIRIQATAAVDWVAVDLPVLRDGQYLYQFFHWENWAGLLPVLHFLKALSPWTPPPLRACFMFDDPNLHWRTYGYADYRQLAGHAAAHHYHATFATVPADTWYTNRSTAAIFRQHRDCLSLLIHGNNHTACELANTSSEADCRILAAQAMQRMARLEKKAGFPIPRVMVAPHEACNHEMAGALLQAGFEGVCISRGSIIGRNPGLTWPVTIGLGVTDFLGTGLPVIPRFNIGLGRDAEINALLAAFLGQPIIPVGHHQDLATGPGLLSHLAGWINSVGTVAWMDLTAMAESSFSTSRCGSSLGIRMHVRRIRITVPEGVTELWVERPWLKAGGKEDFEMQGGESSRLFPAYQGTPVPVRPGQVLELTSRSPQRFDPWSITVPGTPFWALIRRQLCEVRDRLRPFWDRWFRPPASSF